MFTGRGVVMAPTVLGNGKSLNAIDPAAKRLHCACMFRRDNS